MEQITSRTNPLCTHLRKLASSRAYREETGEFLCDSPKLLSEAELWGFGITALLYTSGAALEYAPETYGAARTVLVSESVMSAVSPMETPQGVVFTCRAMGHRPPETLTPDKYGRSRYLLLDGVQDPGNVGTMLRTADAFGWTVFLLPGCADVYNPKTLRAAMGVHFRSVIYRDTLEHAAALLHAAGLPLYAAALGEDTADVRTLDLRRCAVIVGSEGRGVSAEALALCDRRLKIPMDRTCESLNAAAAAAVLLWEGARQEGAEE